MKVLLSIKPEFAKAIFNGKKKFEYRKVLFKKEVKTIQVYVTRPVGKIIGEFEIEEIIEGNPAEVWEKTKRHSGIKKSFYMQYFQDKQVAYAIKIKNINKYKEPLCPYKEYENFTAPQSFRYI
ncbi:bacteriophage protein [Helicobacter mustelae]|uniref:ASCH domain-containing protein n=1 Tax=Helicobacter mustelae TaxID=217 RepID=UPI000E07E0DE|nr:ASCH domain-containing protein [Helicobacter mustelae]STP13099.1 bacteriophage protein [Helicobacter mustelae]